MPKQKSMNGDVDKGSLLGNGCLRKYILIPFEGSIISRQQPVGRQPVVQGRIPGLHHKFKWPYVAKDGPTTASQQAAFQRLNMVDAFSDDRPDLNGCIRIHESGGSGGKGANPSTNIFCKAKLAEC